MNYRDLLGTDSEVIPRFLLHRFESRVVLLLSLQLSQTSLTCCLTCSWRRREDMDSCLTSSNPREVNASGIWSSRADNRHAARASSFVIITSFVLFRKRCLLANNYSDIYKHNHRSHCCVERLSKLLYTVIETWTHPTAMNVNSVNSGKKWVVKT